ncbi:MAG TPA: pyruvate, water dikinase regulatory protein [Herpetosiphonaceae bacterium]
MASIQPNSQELPPIFIISGGAGALGKHIARIALSQFPQINPQVLVIPQVRHAEQLPEVIAQVAAKQGIIIHTMVEPTMRRTLVALTEQHRIPAIDTIGDPLAQIASVFGHEPLGQPGLYQRQHEVYLERIHAIEYTVEHDDGRNPHELHQADVVLVGVSRVGKTPLSIYLSVLGWKVANVPLVPHVAPPAELFQIDPHRVVGLTIDVDILLQHRHWRRSAMVGTTGRDYTEPEMLQDEIMSARRLCRRHGFALVNVTNKPIEETADQVIALLSRWFEMTVQ